MNQRETLAVRKFTKASEKRLLIHRMESAISCGIPDLIGENKRGATFWIEAKALEHWPRRKDTLPLAGSFEAGQIPFLREWRQWGGYAFVLLQCEGVFYLLDPYHHSRIDLREQNTNQMQCRALAEGLEPCIIFLENLKNED